MGNSKGINYMHSKNNNLLDKKFHALENQTRREILTRLKLRPHSAGEIAGYFKITPASISYHLSLLKESKLISCQQIERHRLYCINYSELEEVYLWLINLCKSEEKAKN